MSLISVRAELCDLTLDETIRFCAQRLAERTEAGAGAGFTFGPAGAAWALAQVSGFALAARAAIDRAGPPDRTALGWCSGLAGLAVARASVGAVGAVDDGILCDLADRPVLRDLSLCHGELGIVEALTVLAGRVPDGPAVRRRRTGLVLDAIDRYGPSCGTPGSVTTPGLVSGLAGIGYGLLRLGFADRVPSVLLLEPTSPGPG